jgi:hypothetical protein
MRRAGLLLVLLVGTVLLAGAARAQEACKMEMNTPPMKLQDFYAKAAPKAKAWKADAVVAQLTNTSMGPLGADGKSAAWNAQFYSPSAKSTLTISTFRGFFTCYAAAGDAGRIPDLKPDFMRDSARLYAIAKEKGGDLIAKGYNVQVGTAAAPQTRHATWNIQYSKADGSSSGLLVLVDANTGSVEQVLH